MVKELSKSHERVRFCHLSDVIEDTKGEFVLVVNRAEHQTNALCELSIQEHLDYYLAGGMSQKDAIKAVAKDRNVPKNDIYKLTINDKK